MRIIIYPDRFYLHDTAAIIIDRLNNKSVYFFLLAGGLNICLRAQSIPDHPSGHVQSQLSSSNVPQFWQPVMGHAVVVGCVVVDWTTGVVVLTGQGSGQGYSVQAAGNKDFY